MSDAEISLILQAVARVEVEVKQLRTENTKADGLHADHEMRLRSLEAVRWKIAGWAAALGALSGGGIVAALSRALG